MSVPKDYITFQLPISSSHVERLTLSPKYTQLTYVISGYVLIPQIDAISVLLLIKYMKRIGRYTISKLTGLGEGKVRRFLQQLVSLGLAQTTRGGTTLTEHGLQYLHETLSKLNVLHIVILSNFPLATTKYTTLFYCTDLTHVLSRYCLEERDVAVRYGADGAILMLVSRDGKISIPGVCSDLSTYSRPTYNIVNTYLRTGTDLVIATFSNNLYGAIRGGVALLYHLNTKLRELGELA